MNGGHKVPDPVFDPFLGPTNEWWPQSSLPSFWPISRIPWKKKPTLELLWATLVRGFEKGLADRGVGARKLFLCQSFGPLLCTLSPMPALGEGGHNFWPTSGPTRGPQVGPEAFSSPCNFATTHLTAFMRHFNLLVTSRPGMEDPFANCPSQLPRMCWKLQWEQLLPWPGCPL